MSSDERQAVTTSAQTSGGSRLASRISRKSGGRRPRGLTCTNCRARKVRCEGSQPSCRTCQAYNDVCRYEKPPPMSQIVDMAQRLEVAERMIAALQTGAVPDGSALSAVQVGQPSPPQPEFRPAGRDNMGAGRALHPVAAPDVSSVQLADGRSTDDGTAIPTSVEPLAAPSAILTPHAASPDLSVDRDGSIYYYGPTSAIHEPLISEEPHPSSSVQADEAMRRETSALLVAKARETEAWEPFALKIASTQTDIPRPILTKLLQIHWTWISPMFMWVYRPAFISDMCTGGRYYSEFLLIVMCAHAARFYDIQVAEMLVAKARLLLGSAIHRPSSIPTVQALLQLSARDLAYGCVSQAWLYSGLAFRMAADLGLHHTHSAPTAAGLKGLSPVDLEVRRRLFWSCFFWDTAMSLYTGRMPALAEIPDHVNVEFYDTTADSATWSPHHEDLYTFTKLPQGQYPAVKAHYVSCFANSCKLSIILHDIIVQLYSPRRPATEEAVGVVQTRLATWRAQSPSHLRYDADDLPGICPPIYILSQNLLFYTSVVLTHRPFWHTATHYMACRNAVNSIEKLLILLETTFGFENISYLVAYCIYTGATVLVQGARSGDETARAQTQIFTRALRMGAEKCFLLRRSLKIIEQGLHTATAPPGRIGLNRAPGAPAAASSSESPASRLGAAVPPDHHFSTVPGDFPPAFPYLDYSAMDGVGFGFATEAVDGVLGGNPMQFAASDSFFGPL